ncbi:hypothetical protein AciM339_0997 [Aciduliprofundum sp. MAR08-339]|uniref:hypothetical protein n=1 Tax=Aciduliprofundum sp. (strain MAR08-339) TaxID=673860 RepID=UPI0002A4B20A|nr:hypothetical protein AciM339_0997 [Aciduliprofundum sp. MAR08-339]
MNPEDAVVKLNRELGKQDDNLFEVIQIYENFFGEYIVHLKVNRMVKASYSSLKKIAEITGAKDILIERAEGDNLAEIKLMLPKN